MQTMSNVTIPGLPARAWRSVRYNITAAAKVRRIAREQGVPLSTVVSAVNRERRRGRLLLAGLRPTYVSDLPTLSRTLRVELGDLLVGLGG
jgi:hypothetical protein